MKKFLGWTLVIVLLVAAFVGYRQYRARAATEAQTAFQTESVRRGPLTATIGATGSVRANQTAIMTWQTSGTVAEVNVEVGDTVRKGDVLATLEQTSLSQAIIMAQADLVSAQKALDELLKPPSELAIAQAQQAIANAQKAVDQAQQRLDSLTSRARQVDIDSAQATVVMARDKLKKAQEDFAPYANKPEDNVQRAYFQSILAQAQREYDNAVARLNNLLGTANETDLAVAQANLEAAQAQLADARQNYEDLLAGPTEDDIAVAEARVAAAQATVNLARIAAPFDATVTAVESKPGDQVNPGTMAFRLDDLSHLLVDVQISEVDINRVKVGQDVVLTFDAILGKEYQGTVVEVPPVGQAVQGVVNFTVTVELTNPDEDVKPGMTAAVNIVVSQLEDVLLVPNRAVRFLNGERVVYVLENGQPKPVPITLGASSETVSQVLEGDLQEGDAIILNPPAQFNQQGGPPFGR
ncbi:MAG: efflux RND transporter periplasmic adaptor subunit [Anaerolineae bacterium]|nr:MAG: efflux RND transporter periplasmic adaptor subunit [Anaerolineae bacterium]